MLYAHTHTHTHAEEETKARAIFISYDTYIYPAGIYVVIFSCWQNNSCFIIWKTSKPKK